MNLRLYDTMSREKRDFVPRDERRVTMYVCGPTVYGYAHIGNARPVVVFDVLFRVLRHLYGEDAVVYARNVTDVDDKINARAADEGVDIGVITERYLAAYHEDMAALGALRPTLEPRATEHIEAMQAQIAALIERGAAYAADGHVLFDTQSFGDYGKLSGRPLDEMIAGARVEVAPYKRHPADFVLWKPSKPGEPVWESPWGPGRPGWHIECSAMIESELGLPIDIHGGGIDLVFPHHENELAQGVCAHGGGEFARVWMHNGFLDMAGEKMSKSLGNVVVPHDLLKAVPGEALRWALLSAHYRQPLDWTEGLIEQSRASLDRLYGALQRVKGIAAERTEPPAAFLDALADDLNTPKAIAELFALAKALETAHGEAEKARLKGELLAAANLIGFLDKDPDVWFAGAADEGLRAQVEALLEQRLTARNAKDWPTADRIREQLDELGVIVMDGPAGATWRLKEPA
ncbi:MAG TPA: cysteine--tRNA ligase [Caulobacteraceae bacterium]|nr:cysteine--tRNA ligase [Caulobacteraceae bacterium]